VNQPLELVSCGEFSEFLVAGFGGAEGEEGEKVAGFAFVAQDQASVSGQPRYRPFDHPAVLAEFVAALDAFARDADIGDVVRSPRSRSR
jgi:hypothetical protein